MPRRIYLSPFMKKSSFNEIGLVYSAEEALKIIGKILEFCAGSDTLFGAAFAFIVFPSAKLAYVFFHNKLLSTVDNFYTLMLLSILADFILTFAVVKKFNDIRNSYLCNI